jgi:hypothetical protein
MTTTKRYMVNVISFALATATCVGLAVYAHDALDTAHEYALARTTHDQSNHVLSHAQPCEYEDASGPNDGPVCEWEADSAGLANGGDSFVALRLDPCMTVYLYRPGDSGTVDLCDGSGWTADTRDDA